MSRFLFIIGNGFDLAHKLPTRFDPDFKNFARRMETDGFWDLYQSRQEDIWSDFENLLGCPDFNSLEEIFSGYEPDYLSDRESDRDAIIYQVDLNGNLDAALKEFAFNAERHLSKTKKNPFLEQILDSDGYYISFNYTHTLEKIYDIPADQVLHIHGEVGMDNLMLGYPQGEFTPEKYSYDVRKKGRPVFCETDFKEYIQSIEDYYVRTAYENLYDKCESFYKVPNLDTLEFYLDESDCDFEEIIVYGHSCAIDFPYFKYLNERYANARWTFYVYGIEQERNVRYLVEEYQIKNVTITDISVR